MQETWFNSWVGKIRWRRGRLPTLVFLGFPGGSVDKESACRAADLGLIPLLGRYPGGGKGYPLQYSGLENSMDCTVHGVTKNQTQLSDFTSLLHLSQDFFPLVPNKLFSKHGIKRSKKAAVRRSRWPVRNNWVIPSSLLGHPHLGFLPNWPDLRPEWGCFPALCSEPPSLQGDQPLGGGWISSIPFLWSHLPAGWVLPAANTTYPTSQGTFPALGCLVCCLLRAKSLQLCPTLCDPMDSSPPGSSVQGILEARIREWVPCPPPKNLPDARIELVPLTSPALADGYFTTSATWLTSKIPTLPSRPVEILMDGQNILSHSRSASQEV